MSKLFISYRRVDSEDATGRIYDRLAERYGEDNVFKDVNSIRYSVDFREAVRTSILGSRVTLVVIGRGWLNALDEQGNRRLDNPADFVRIEIETALNAPNMAVIPVLVGRAAMPAADDLPPSLQQLAYLNAAPVRPDPDFPDDLQKLIDETDQRMRLSWVRRLLLFAGSVNRSLLVGLMLVLVVSVVTYWNSADYATLPDSSSEKQSMQMDSVEADTEAVVRPALDTIIPYNPHFIGKRTIPLPDLPDQLSAGDILDGRVFDYVHYSLIMDERRAMPLYTAYNVDRASTVRVPRKIERWEIDPRIPTGLQTDDVLYKGNDWDRGHMVPRRAVTWGDSSVAVKAARGVFFYSNTVPQHRIFNQRNWNDLENFVLNQLRPDSKRLSVFAGPVSRSTDIEYRGRRVPRSFWMIAVLSDETNPRNFFVHAYLMDQYALSPDGGYTPTPPIRDFNPRTYEVSVTQIEGITPLRFSNLR